jgi:L-lactate dehydrogenase complex protein LldF
MDDLEGHLAAFTAAVEARGGRVHRCPTAEDAGAKVVEICRAAEARLVAKSKSMLSEEIRLNEALDASGIRAVETDLGEYILQLAGEHPVHIIAPAIEKTARDVAHLFALVEGAPVGERLDDLTQAARRQLREVFLAADVGVTGVNFGVAETGSVCLVTNEGNGRLVSALPRVHVALMGIERVVPALADLALLLRLLARSATGQRLTRTRPSSPGRGARTRRMDPRSSTSCWWTTGARACSADATARCSTASAAAPASSLPGLPEDRGRRVGPVYSGPMGAVLVPLLAGLEQAPALPHASSLCGACPAACPVRIPLHELLLELRRDLAEQGLASRAERLGFLLWSLAWSRPAGYRVTARLARLLRPVAGLAGPGRVWTEGRELPPLPRRQGPAG